MAHVRNPKTHKPESRMPAYDENKINNEDLQALAEFLASLNGEEGGEAKEEPDKVDEAESADQK
jgi:cbb3-type cytochrome oxidase cytochrome c subunit